MSFCTKKIQDENVEKACNNTETNRIRTVTSLAGKDLVAGGTWLGLDASHRCCVARIIEASSTEDTKSEPTNEELTNNNENTNTLRWIALTNFIDGEIETTHNKTSRGSILAEYLDTDPQNTDAETFAKSLCTRGQEYNGFSVLIADANGVYYCTNRKRKCIPSMISGHESTKTFQMYECTFDGPLPPGIYGLSNGLLDSPWAKIQRGKEKLSKLLNDTYSSSSEFHKSLMNLLRDDLKPTNKNDQYPDSNRSSIFVPEFELDGRAYGTRSSTTICMNGGGKISVLERDWLSSTDSWFDLLPK